MHQGSRSTWQLQNSDIARDSQHKNCRDSVEDFGKSGEIDPPDIETRKLACVMTSSDPSDSVVREHIPQSLWIRAWETLDEPLKAKLDYTGTNRINIVSAALGVAQEKKRICIQKRWKFTRPNGDIIILRDIVEKIIEWLEKFKTVGNQLMQYNVSHAAIPWAAVRFVLQIAVNDQHAFGSTVTDLESISRLITRYAIFEEVYLRQPSKCRSELETTLIGLYVEVLSHLAKIRQYFETSAIKRLMKSATSPNEDGRMQTILSIERRASELANINITEWQQKASHDSAMALAALNSFEAPIKRISDQVDIALTSLQEEKYLSMVRWLSCIPYPRHHDRIARDRIPNTGKWLLTHSSYNQWRSSSSSAILSLQGTVGSGKTCLSSLIIDEFQKDFHNNAMPVPFAYFYCARNSFEQERSDPEEIMRSIVRQMTIAGNGQRTVLEILVNEFERREAEAKIDGFDIPRLSRSECVKLIFDITSSNSAVIVIDAIDEVQETCQYALIEDLVHIATASASVVKIFMTFRDTSQAAHLVPNANIIRIDGRTIRPDMDSFVLQHIDRAVRSKRLLGGKVPEELRKDLTVKLSDTAADMYVITISLLQWQDLSLSDM